MTTHYMINAVLILISLIASYAFSIVMTRSTKEEKIETAHDYLSLNGLFDRTERQLYETLIDAVDDDIVIFAKVRATDILTPNKAIGSCEWWPLFYKISRKHFDFVLCRQVDMCPVCIIEIDNHGHKRHQVKKEFIQQICHHAGITIIYIPNKHRYSTRHVKTTIIQEMGKNKQ